MMYPDFIKIIWACRTKMDDVYAKYHNSWVNYQGLQFWKKRLEDEIDEIWQAESFEQYQAEIIDVINILSMMYDKPDDWTFSEKFRLELRKKK